MTDADALFGVAKTSGCIPCIPLTKTGLSKWLAGQPQAVRNWVKASSFLAQPQQCCLLPDAGGKLAMVLVGVGKNEVLPALGALSNKLPPGNYRIDCDADVSWSEEDTYLATLGYALGGYKFTSYKSQANKRAAPPKFWLEKTWEDMLRAEAEAVYLVRDLINTPAADMMPKDLAAVAERLAKQYSGACRSVTGKKLATGYPMIHAVGRASVHQPQLIELTWGQKRHPLLALVGKGISFDSGGLDLKSAAGMRLMKKDMGGAAHVLGLAQLIMSQKLPVRLLVLVAAAENAVSGDSFRPGDVLKSRQGIQVEIDNTDAEGRLVLGDALTYAGEQKPKLIIDFATLTGAARVALGPSVGAFFTNNDKVATGLAKASESCEDAIWRLPLHAPYQAMLSSNIADCANSGNSPFAGAITAALFLQQFVAKNTPWAHFDVMGWNVKASATGPAGGEAQGLRAAYRFVRSYLAKG